ncbi:MAG: glycosyltransferase [Streptococcaceae bacterium]|jgi:glycosyltransferase involved in cell wall biosynthesis|nr:glycosyltransferase [Streptococcaceae bacterium]
MRKENIHLQIETIENDQEKNQVFITGWGFDEQARKPLKYLAVDGKKVTLSVVKRDDVVAVHKLEDKQRYGFKLKILNHQLAKKYTLTFLKGSGQEITFQLDRENKNGKNNFQRMFTLLKMLKKHGLKTACENGYYYLKKTNDYKEWIRKNENFNVNEVKKEIANFSYQPLISLVTPVYNVEEKWFLHFIQSIKDQYYTNWELCLADDASTNPYIKSMLEAVSRKDSRIKIVYRARNGHISEATNSAIKITTGEYIAFIDNDDELAPHALYESVKAINKDFEIDFLYSDEDKLRENGERIEPFFKPNWNAQLLLAHNYITHLVVVSRLLLEKVGEFRTEFNGSQDYDFILRATEKAKKIHHISSILYHWRMIATSTAENPESKIYAFTTGQKALTESLQRKGIAADVLMDRIHLGLYHIQYPLTEFPIVSIIFTKFFHKGIKNWAKFKKNTKYPNIEVVEEKKIEKAIKKARGKYLLFLSGCLDNVDENENVDPLWLKNLIMNITRSEIGLVAGVIANKKGQILNIGFSFDVRKKAIIPDELGVNRHTIGTYFRTVVMRFVGAVTTAFALVEKSDLEKIAVDWEESQVLSGIELSFAIRNRLQKTVLFTPGTTLFTKNDSVIKISQSTKKALWERNYTQEELDPYQNLVKI